MRYSLVPAPLFSWLGLAFSTAGFGSLNSLVTLKRARGADKYYQKKACQN
jgi:hypothetical protein